MLPGTAAMKAALDQAKKITADEAAAQSEVNAASDALREAINGLEKVGHPSLLSTDPVSPDNPPRFLHSHGQWLPAALIGRGPSR